MLNGVVVYIRTYVQQYLQAQRVLMTRPPVIRVICKQNSGRAGPWYDSSSLYSMYWLREVPAHWTRTVHCRRDPPPPPGW